MRWVGVLALWVLTVGCGHTGAGTASTSDGPEGVMEDRVRISAEALEGFKAYEAKDFEKAVRYLQPAAEMGMPQAQLVMGMISVTKEDGVNAIKWMRLAAEQDLLDAQLACGTFLLMGLGGDVQRDEAAKWFRRAIEQGVTLENNGQLAEMFGTLARGYEKGDGGPPDAEEALFWWSRSADAGSVKARSLIAIHYLEGDGLERNPEKGLNMILDDIRAGHQHPALIMALACAGLYGMKEELSKAHMWFSIVRAKGADSELEGKLEGYTELAEELSAKLTAEELKESEAAAKQCVESQFEDCLLPTVQGNVEKGRAAYNTGDFTGAYWSYVPLAEEGHGEAQYRVGILLLQGRGVVQDIPKSIEWLKAGFKTLLAQAEEGDAHAQELVAEALANALGTSRNMKEALRWYEAAAKQGKPRSQMMWANALDGGFWGVKTDKKKAEEGYIKSRAGLEKLAEEGNIDAFHDLFVMAQHGLGGEKDDAAAQTWLIRAAEGGSPVAQRELATAYRKGKFGLEKDLAKSADWTEKGAQQGDPRSLHNFAELLDAGEGRNKDREAAQTWFKRSFVTNNALRETEPYSGYLLALQYGAGKGVKQDVEKANSWMRKAAFGGVYEARWQLYSAHFDGTSFPQDDENAFKWFIMAYDDDISTAEDPNGDTLKSRMSVAAQKRARAAAKACIAGLEKFESKACADRDVETVIGDKKKRAEEGSVTDQIQLSQILQEGYFVPKDVPGAVKYLHMAAEQGDADTQSHLGFRYFFGTFEGTEKDPKMAVKWLEKATEQGHREAMGLLGQIYQNGAEGVPQNSSRAVEVLTAAVEKGHLGAMMILGNMYKNGTGMPRDMDKAMAWFLRAGEEGGGSAPLTLVKLYVKGTDIERDLDAAEKWALKGLELGDAKGATLLASMWAAGKGVPVDFKKAAKWADLGAKAGDKHAQMMMGALFMDGAGVKKDLTKARNWLSKAARQGVTSAQFLYANMLAQMPDDENRINGMTWHHVAASQGHEGSKEVIKNWESMLKKAFKTKLGAEAGSEMLQAGMESKIDSIKGAAKRCIDSQYKACP